MIARVTSPISFQALPEDDDINEGHILYKRKKFQLANREYLTGFKPFSHQGTQNILVYYVSIHSSLLTIYQQTFVLKSHLHEGLLTSYLSTSLCQEEMLTQKLNIQLGFMANLEIRMKRAGD